MPRNHAVGHSRPTEHSNASANAATYCLPVGCWLKRSRHTLNIRTETSGINIEQKRHYYRLVTTLWQQHFSIIFARYDALLLETQDRRQLWRVRNSSVLFGNFRNEVVRVLSLENTRMYRTNVTTRNHLFLLDHNLITISRISLHKDYMLLFNKLMKFFKVVVRNVF